MPKHLRLDAELVRRGLARSRTEAKQAIEEGVVVVNGSIATRPATMVAAETPVSVTRDVRRFVSRGGDKLDGALDRLRIDVAGRRWLDAGASTGGFTDCLLQRGAAGVIAVDVGYGQLDWKLRNDERVVVLERTNIRHIDRGQLAWEPAGIVADLSFISLRSVLSPVLAVAADDADVIVLVKPQFEVGRANVGTGGVVRDAGLWAAAIRDVADAAAHHGARIAGATASNVPGPAGNREFFVWFRRDVEGDPEAIDRAVAEADGG